MNRRSFNKMLAAAFGSAAIGLTPALMKSGPKKINLAEYCELDAYRYSLDKPFIQSGHQIATDGRILIRLPALGDDGDGENRRVPDLDRFNWDLFDCRGWKPWPKLEVLENYGACVSSCRTCRGFGRVNFRQCDCPGVKYQSDGYADTSQWCGFCDSEGETGDACPTCKGKNCCFDKAAVIGTSGVLNTRFDSMIRADIVRGYAPHAAEAIAFRFDGGVGLVMPLSKREQF